MVDPGLCRIGHQRQAECRPEDTESERDEVAGSASHPCLPELIRAVRQRRMAPAPPAGGVVAVIGRVAIPRPPAVPLPPARPPWPAVRLPQSCPALMNWTALP